jgi:hypothetical protein
MGLAGMNGRSGQAPAPRADEELAADMAEIDRMLESQSAWLTPRCRSALLSAREVLVQALQRRKVRWPTLAMAMPDAGERPRAIRVQ